jgi:hypothetical protein
MTTFSLIMIVLSILVFLIAVILNDYEIMNGAVLPFTENVLAIFSVALMGIGISVAIFNRLRRKIQTRGHNFETVHRRVRRSG